MSGSISVHAQLRRVRLLLIGGIVLVALAAAGGRSLAHGGGTAVPATCTKTWTGAASTVWTASGNWTPSGAPIGTSTNYVCIGSTANQPSLATGNTISIAG